MVAGPHNWAVAVGHRMADFAAAFDHMEFGHALAGVVVDSAHIVHTVAVLGRHTEGLVGGSVVRLLDL